MGDQVERKVKRRNRCYGPERKTPRDPPTLLCLRRQVQGNDLTRPSLSFLARDLERECGPVDFQARIPNRLSSLAGDGFGQYRLSSL